MKVYTVTVFESGDGKTSVWGVYDSLEKASGYKEVLINDKDLNDGDYYIEVSVQEHEVE